MGEGLSHTCFQGLEKLCLGAAVLPGHLSPCFKRVGTAEPGCLKVKPLKKKAIKTAGQATLVTLHDSPVLPGTTQVASSSPSPSAQPRSS